MPAELSSNALRSLIDSLLSHSSEWAAGATQGYRMAFSSELRTALREQMTAPERKILDPLLVEPTWEEVLESTNPVVLQQACWVAERSSRPFLADSFAALADVLEEAQFTSNDPLVTSDAKVF